MKKYFIISILFFCLIGITRAQNIDTKNAQLVADNFYNQNSQKQFTDLALAYTEKTATGDTCLYFIYNVNKSDGWVIIAADSASLPILGYSLAGHYASGNLSPEFLFWMSRYKDEILYIKRNGIQATEDIKNDWRRYSEPSQNNNKLNNSNTVLAGVSPLLSTTWDQEPFYNANCPSGTPTGCVATAMAQIMKYWNYPAHGYGMHSYYLSAYGNLFANFGNTTYEWACMPNSINSANSAISTLMYQCGVSVEMNYGPNPQGSLAHVLVNECGNIPCNYCAQNAYWIYFNYATTIQGILRSSYSTTSAWINKLKAELDAGRPIQYAGWDDNNHNIGHTWVCDGYDAQNRFHMNWGWGGNHNGNFVITALNPGVNHFNFHDEALIGIKPAVAPSCPNDECANAITLVTCEKKIVNNFGATASNSAPNISCYSGSVRDVWFKINPTSTDLSVETFQTSCLSDLVIQVLSGSCGSLHEIACGRSAGATPANVTITNLPNLNPLYLRVTDAGANDVGEFGIMYKQTASGTPIFNPVGFIAGDVNVIDFPTIKGDVNGDGKTDLIFIYQDRTNGLSVRSKISNGNGTYTSVQYIFGDGQVTHDDYPKLAADINGDGKTDLLFIYRISGKLVVKTKISNGNGSFTAYEQTFVDGSEVFQYPVLTGDVNGDGKTDLLFLIQDPAAGLIIRTKISNGNGTFTSYQQVQGDGGGVHQYPTLTGDVNGDGKTDLIFIYDAGNQGLAIRTKISNGDGTYNHYGQIQGDGSRVHQYPTLTGDVNGDGKTDLIFIYDDVNQGLAIRTKMSNGDGTYTNYGQILGDGAGVHDYPALTGDVDGDGKADIIFTGQNWISCGLNIRVKRSNGDGTWCAAWQGLPDGSRVHQYPTLTGDVNGDGKTDLIFIYNDVNQGLAIRTKMSQAANLCQPGGIAQLPQQGSEPFIIYPNPTKGIMQIQPYDSRLFGLEIFDLNGRLLSPKAKFTGPKQVDLTAFSSGIYLINLFDISDNKKYSKKVVKIN